jgi:cysteine synthase A
MAVDAKGSVIFGYPSECRLIPGHGAGIVPPLYYANLETTHILVSDLDCVVGCRQLAQREAIFAGGSAGGIMTAILKMQPEIPAGSTCVAIFGDQGGRYIETIYNDDWVKEWR